MPFPSSINRRDFLSSVAAVCLDLKLAGASSKSSAPSGKQPKPLEKERFHQYVEQFQKQELAVTGSAAPDPWNWMVDNIPWFECSDPAIEEIYYFRWYAFQKHIEKTGRGHLLSEFLLKVPWGGYGNTVVDAAPHHLRESRWLRQDSVAIDYAQFWQSPDAAPRNYSVALADAVRAVALVKDDRQLQLDMLPFLIDNLHAWETTRQDTNGLFWSIDTRDAMEVSISGDGYRPTLNSYIYGDARAIAAMARLAGKNQLAEEFDRKAAEQRLRVERELWNPVDKFYEVRSPLKNSGIRAEKKFKDNGTVLKISEVRELIGYIPWYFNLPIDREHAIAWRQIADPQGFQAPFGPTTAERRSPRFRFKTNDKCPWNGPSWAFATTQALVALGNLLNGQSQPYVGKQEYLNLLSTYAHSHRLKLPSGELVPWIDEAQDPDTGNWITRSVLQERHSTQFGRGNYYNHSGFADPLITGCVGLRPREDDMLEINPLVPAGSWKYFALEAVPYRGHLLTILYDETGERYQCGRGVSVWRNGKQIASRSSLGKVSVRLT